MDAGTAELQQKQIAINGRATLALMNRVQARGCVIVKGKPLPLRYPYVCANMEREHEEPCGGYVRNVTKSMEDYRNSLILDADGLPSFDEELRKAAQYFSEGPLGSPLHAGEGRLQLTLLDVQTTMMVARVAAGGAPLLAEYVVPDDTEFEFKMLAQGELSKPMLLHSVKSFHVDVYCITGEHFKLGPFSGPSVIRSFKDDCKERKRFLQSRGHPIESVILNAPYMTNIVGGDSKICFWLVKYNKHTCLLGISLSMRVAASLLPPCVECSVCLEECQPDQWACPRCRNLFHHTCVESLYEVGIRACPMCRFDHFCPTPAHRPPV